MKLLSHPRLYIGPQELSRLKRKPQTVFLKAARARITRDAARWAQMPPLTFDPDRHNSFLARAREVQTRVLTLLTRWRQTDNDRFRNAALAYIGMIGAWECWSWITWRQGNFSPTAIYDLSYGENAATLALAYDLMYETLSPAEKNLFLETASKWPFASAAVHCRPNAAWWFGAKDSNWNTVCAGGLGMLCLSMFEDLPQAKQLLPSVERSFEPFMRHLDTTSGAWPEGIGYWNYGMYYAFMYLLSRERSTGRRHPLMKLPGVGKTLAFPLDFTPHGKPCSFGDSNHWRPLPFHYAAARRLRNRSVRHGIDAFLQKDPQNACRGQWAPAAGWLLFHEDRLETGFPPKPLGAKLYHGLDWAVLADQYPEPQLYMSVRGGNTNVPHGHCDLFSFNIVVNGEKMISNEGNAEYLDTTFSPRRYELPDINAQFKNTIFINGLGVAHGACLEPAGIFNRRGVSGIRLEGTEAMGLGRANHAAAPFCGRLFLLLDKKALLIIDRVATAYPARVESRLHTHAETRLQPRGARLRLKRQDLRLAFAADIPCILAQATTAPTTPTFEPARVLRWCARELNRDMLLAVLAVPGNAPAGVNVTRHAGKLIFSVKFRQHTVQIEATERLEFLRIG